MHIGDEEFKILLLKSKILVQAEFKEAEEEAKRSGQPLINILLGRQSISEKFLNELLASFFRVQTTDLRDIEGKKEIVRMIPEELAKKKHLIAFDFDEKERILKLAMEDPGDLETIKFLEMKLNCKIEPYVTSLTHLERGFRQYEKKLKEKVWA